jgi:hypothetical protein
MLIFIFLLVAQSDKPVAKIPEGGKARYVSFGPDGKTVVAIICLNGKEHLLVNDAKGPEMDTVFPPRGKPTDAPRYKGIKGGKYFIIEGTSLSEPSDEFLIDEFSPDGKRLAYVMSSGGKKSVVVDGVMGEAFDYL